MSQPQTQESVLVYRSEVQMLVENNIFKNHLNRAGAILVTLPDDLCLIPSTPMACNHCNYSSMASNALFWPFLALGMPVVHRHTQAKYPYT